MSPSLLLAACLSVTPSTQGPLPALVEEEITRAAAVRSARVQIADLKLHWNPACALRKAEVPALSGSTQVAVRLFGETTDKKPCQGWAWVKVQLFVQAWVTRQALDGGERLSDKVVAAERELVLGRPLLAELSQHAVAAHRLGPNVALEPAHVREKGPSLGQKVTVVLAMGSLNIEQEARTVPCAKGLACALLPNGRRVEGRWDGARILLESP